MRTARLSAWALPLLLVAGTARAKTVIAASSGTVSTLLGEITARAIERTGDTDVVRRFHLPGDRAESLLTDGDADLAPAGAAALARRWKWASWPATPAEATAAARKKKIEITAPLGSGPRFALAVRADDAALQSIADLAKRPLRVMAPGDFADAPSGWAAVRSAYGLSLALSTGPAMTDAQAVREKKADVAAVVTDAAGTAPAGLRILADPKQALAAVDWIVAARAKWTDDHEAAWKAVNQAAAAMSGEVISHLASLVEEGQTPAEAADLFLDSLTWRRLEHEKTEEIKLAPDERPVADPYRHWKMLARLTREHLFLVFAPLILALAVALPLGLFLARSAEASDLVLNLSGVFKSLPAVVVLCFLIPLFGVGAPPALIAIFLSSAAILLPSVVRGARSVPPALADTAVVLGLTRAERARLIELPAAGPAILRAARSAATLNVGTATIAAFFGAGGFGTLIVTGLALSDLPTLLRGAAPVALLAILIRWLFEFIDWAALPRAIRD